MRNRFYRIYLTPCAAVEYHNVANELAGGGAWHGNSLNSREEEEASKEARRRKLRTWNSSPTPRVEHLATQN
jgi:hypothetical protein